MFQIGDRVKCINAKKGDFQTSLVLNREYIVYGIKTFPCGCVGVDVGIFFNEKHHLRCACSKNYTWHVYKGDIEWSSSKRFVKVQDKREYIAVQSNVEVEELILN